MANELTISASLKFSKSGREANASKGGLQIDVTGDKFIRHVQEIGTSEEAIVMSADVPAGGYMYLENLDSTNYVEIRPATGTADLVRLNAGEIALFRLTSTATAPYAIADTAAVDLLVVLIEA